MIRKIAFYSQKGGTGKTTACGNIGAALAAMGRRVLIVDLGGNACASRIFGRIVGGAESVVAAFRGKAALASVVCETPIAALRLAPGSPELRTVQLAARLDEAGLLRADVFALELAQLGEDAFDYVLIDCPGGNPFMDHAALLACDEVIVPTGLSVYDLYGATPMLALIVQARKVRGDGRPRFLGFLPNGASKADAPPRLQAKLDSYRAPCFAAVRQSATLKTIASAN
jgi:chromosome partitioning protein